MFENDNSQLFLTAGMIHNRRVANEQANRAANAEAYARNATAYVRELEARVIALREEAEVRSLELLVEKAHASGLEAQLNAMKAAAPNCSALASSGRKFTSGNPKTVARIAYEAAFDAFLRQNGVANPVGYRAN